MANETQWLMWP